MSFGDGLKAFRAVMHSRSKDLFFGMANEVTRSVVDGSEITGARGQPVDTGNLKGSFIPAFVSASEFQLTTNVAYAEAVEEGIGRYGQPVSYGKSGTGGSHSIKKTMAAIQNIADHVNKQIGGGE